MNALNYLGHDFEVIMKNSNFRKCKVCNMRIYIDLGNVNCGIDGPNGTVYFGGQLKISCDEQMIKSILE